MPVLEPIFYLDLDDEANAKYLKAGVLFDELTAILDKNPNRKAYIFLDEVHDVEGWEKTVNSIRKRKNADGRNARTGVFCAADRSRPV